MVGYTGDGVFQCTDVNKCLIDNDDCGNRAMHATSQLVTTEVVVLWYNLKLQMSIDVKLGRFL